MQNTNKLIAIFLQCHDFYVAFANYMDQKGLNTNIKANHTQTVNRLHPSEIMTIVIFYHMAGFKCFKYYYNQYTYASLKSYFPAAPSFSPIFLSKLLVIKLSAQRTIFTKKTNIGET